MEIKNETGWVVCQVKKTVAKATMVCPEVDDRGAFTGGHVRVYFTRKQAMKDAKALMDSWKTTEFIVRPVTVVLE